MMRKGFYSQLQLLEKKDGMNLKTKTTKEIYSLDMHTLLFNPKTFKVTSFSIFEILGEISNGQEDGPIPLLNGPTRSSKRLIQI